ncbi:MAG: hypothetical protein QM739_03680 [Propionivibrio sp.]
MLKFKASKRLVNYWTQSREKARKSQCFFPGETKKPEQLGWPGFLFDALQTEVKPR